MKKILILGGSGFIGNSLYKELYPYFDTHATYLSENAFFAKNQKFHQFDMERESISILLENLRPNVIISALRGNFDAQVHAHFEIIEYLLKHKNTKLIFLSSANVFDAFTNYPSYEYDKTLSQSVYGRFKIKIENALLRLPNNKYVIARLPMVFGANSPRVTEIKRQLKENEAIEVFSNVVVNATSEAKLTQQLHYIINRNRQGVFHLGSNDLVHHNDLITDICETLGEKKPLLKNVFDSNFDRFLAVIPKDNLLPKNLQISIQEVVASTLVS
ncbi:MAG: sugar nucleotide-binding protein [Salinimicrobium sediminis]|nr:sugar nucleotide-binding protein [Salinimicrobium sediminis]